jgi:hypothetical protein
MEVETTSNPVEQASPLLNKPKSLMVGSRVYAVNRINTAEEYFEVDFRIFLSWNAKDFKRWDPQFSTDLYIANALSSTADIVDQSPGPVLMKDNILKKSWRVLAKVKGSFRLMDFPFDSQTLHIHVRVPRVDMIGSGASEVISDPDQSAEYRMEEESSKNSWIFQSATANLVMEAPGKPNFKPRYTISLQFSRLSDYYLKNIAAPNALLALLAFSIFFVDPFDIVSRINIILVILLTVIAFKFSVANLLPVLNYETLLEKYIMGLVFMTFGFGIETILLSMIASKERAKVLDVIFGLAAIAAFLLWHLWFGLTRSRLCEGRTHKQLSS